MKQLEGAIGTGQAKITGKSSGDAGRPPRRPASWIRIRRSGRIPSDCQIGNCASYGAIESARLKRPLPAPTLACFTPTLAPCAGGRRTLLLEEWAGALVERREGLVARYRGDELEVVPRPLRLRSESSLQTSTHRGGCGRSARSCLCRMEWKDITRAEYCEGG